MSKKTTPLTEWGTKRWNFSGRITRMLTSTRTFMGSPFVSKEEKELLRDAAAALEEIQSRWAINSARTRKSAQRRTRGGRR